MRFALLLLLSLTSVFAAEKKYNLRDFAPAKYITGPRLTTELQKDKATLLVFWIYEYESARGGDNLKRFQKIAEEHKDKLVVIGVEDMPVYGQATPKNITALAKKAGATFTIYSGCKSPITKNLYPYVCVFDKEGKMTYNGVASNEDFAEAIAGVTAGGEKKEGKDEKDKPKTDPKKAA
jgi:hypothetical protein